MTALERINKYTDQLTKEFSCQMCGFDSEENAFLLKAFRVMRDMSIQRQERVFPMAYASCAIHTIDEEFEEKMK